MGFPWGSAGKESACNEGNLGSIPGLGRSPGEGKGYPLQYSGLENSGLYSSWVAKSRTRQSNLHTHFKLRSYSKCIYLNFVFLLKGNCFTILCWFLPYISMNRPWVYTSVPSSWSFLPSSIPFPPPRLSQCAEVNSR